MTLTMADMAASAAGQDGTVGSGDGPRSGRPKRRAFTAEYKMRILRQYEELADDPQARGALLRREGLYTSHLSEWRRARDASTENGDLHIKKGEPANEAPAATASAPSGKHLKSKDELPKQPVAQ